MSRFRVLVVDDEPLARGTLVDLLARDPEVEVLGECGDGRTARQQIRSRSPDIVFLDIEMPELDGLRLGAELSEGRQAPCLVYVTAYARHAVEAFGLAATDYLVKPFSDQRFASALERAKQRVRERRLGTLAHRVAELSDELTGAAARQQPAAGRAEHLERLSIRSSSRTLVVPVDDIVWISSEDYYARIHTRRGRHLLRTSLDLLEQRLDPRRFVRVHRGAIVAVAEVREVVDLFKGAREVVLSDGARTRISRARWAEVAKRLLPAISPG